jgi:AcrR family transcriptional regulator
MGDTGRDALIDAAHRCLARHGFAGTTEQMILESSGVEQKAIAEHFGTLDGLLLTALSTHFRRWLEPLLHAFTDAGSDPRARFDRGFELFFAELPARSPLNAAWLEAVALSQRDDTLRERIATNQLGFRRALATTLTERGAERSDELAQAISTAVDGSMVQYLLHRDVLSFDRLAADLREAFAPP